jgi:hypothetical protein
MQHLLLLQWWLLLWVLVILQLQLWCSCVV